MKNGLLLILFNGLFFGISANAAPQPSLVRMEKNGTLRLSAEKGKAIGCVHGLKGNPKSWFLNVSTVVFTTISTAGNRRRWRPG